MTEFVNMGIISGGLSWLWFCTILLTGILIPKMQLPSNKKAKSKKAGNQSSEKSADRQTKTEAADRKLNDEEIIGADLSELNDHEFERLIALYYKDRGYDAQLVDRTEDHEVGIILTDPKNSRKIAVQCKHGKATNIENDTILKLSAEKRSRKCLDAWCITTSNYTKTAKETAEGLNIELLDGQHVQDFIGNWQRRKRVKANKGKRTSA